MPKYPLHNSPYFDIREFVDRRTWQLLGVRAAWLIDPKIVRTCDLLREKAGPLIVNNWHTGRAKNPFDSSGFRAVWDTTGGQLSQHRCGRAADVKSRSRTPADLLRIINSNNKEFAAAGLTAIEALDFTPTWLHLDCRPVEATPGGFLVVRP